MKKIYIAGILLILLTPLGLLAPSSAWGEWGLEEIKSMVGYVPPGMSRFSEVVKAILPGYSILGFSSSFLQSALGYIFSAVIGIGAILIIFSILGRTMGKPAKKDE